MKYLSLFLAILLISCDSEPQTPSEPQLLRVSYDSEVTEKERDYFVYLPKGYHEQESWPVMLFLHGNGERGNAKDELDFVLAHGPLYESWIQKRDLPFVIIAPQLPMFSMGEVPYIKNRKKEDLPQRLEEGTPPRPNLFPANRPMDGIPMDTTLGGVGPEGWVDGWFRIENEVMSMVDATLKNYKTDKSRVYITGLSYGGVGTWYLTSTYSDIFAAAVPVVGWGHPELMQSIVDAAIPVWCFAGGRDQAVPVQYFYPGINKLEELGHKDFRFTTEEDMNHDVWRRTYAGEDIYNWMLTYQK
ncbi:MAG: prolyl oligopeptidase family serine peptidase [Cyclobacteriaceae bacterium]